MDNHHKSRVQKNTKKVSVGGSHCVTPTSGDAFGRLPGPTLRKNAPNMTVKASGSWQVLELGAASLGTWTGKCGPNEGTWQSSYCFYRASTHEPRTLHACSVGLICADEGVDQTSAKDAMTFASGANTERLVVLDSIMSQARLSLRPHPKKKTKNRSNPRHT